MTRFIEVLFIALSVGWIFWPWMLAIAEAFRWFFHFAPLFAWDENRIAAAMVWPVPALLVWVFFLWIFGEAIR